jgi:hypothetical protein
VNAYYENPAVQARMIEFLGGSSLTDITGVYLTAGDICAPRHREPLPTDQLPALWQKNVDLGRSLWDLKSLIFDIDIEYVNFDFPGEVFIHPQRAFQLQRPVELAAEAVLLDYGIRPLHLLSGRGHHFVWRVGQDSTAFQRLEQIDHLPAGLKMLNSQPHRPTGQKVTAELGAAYAGQGLIMEYLAHRIKDEAARTSQIPVELTAVEAGPGGHGREIVSIDISEYGDPLSTRVIRIPFSRYLKPRQQRYLLGDRIVDRLPPFFLIPLQGMDTNAGLETRCDPAKAAALARTTETTIPDASERMEGLIDGYLNSPLKKIHEWFYTESARPTKHWRERYGDSFTSALPLCVRYDSDHPNDLLLRPAQIRRLTRALLALGWHPRHIAGLLQEKFEGNHGWGDQWKGYSPALRADFYTRMFAGLALCEGGRLIDFNCHSAKEERLCATANCPFNLEQYKYSLLNRRKYERLARRPFNRLFLPEEHL